jgi:replicative DNA helicase
MLFSGTLTRRAEVCRKKKHCYENVEEATMENRNEVKIFQLHELVTPFVKETEAAQAAMLAGRPRGPITGLTALDEILGTYLSPGLHVLQGAPGCGKTAMALQIASDCFYPCLYVTAEMPVLELFRRLVARQTRTFLGKLKTGELGGREAQRLALGTIENLRHLALVDATRGYADVATICKAAEALKESMQTDQILIVIDSLTVWARSAASGLDGLGLSEYEIINQGVMGCTNIANYLNAPVMALSHRNRQGNKGEGGLHAAKGSGSIEYEAESVLDLEPVDRREHLPDSNGEVQVKVTAYKNRHGVPNVPVQLFFSGRLQTFRES